MQLCIGLEWLRNRDRLPLVRAPERWCALFDPSGRRGLSAVDKAGDAAPCT